MKTKITVITLSILALIASSCGQTTKKQTGRNNVVNPDKIDTTFTSAIRPNEKLHSGKIYTDNFEYINHNDQSDDFFFELKKDNKIISLFDGCNEGKMPILNRGDIIEVQWGIDSSWVAGDGDRLEMTEWVISIKKIKDGKVSLFTKKYPKPLKYYYAKEGQYTEWLLDEIYKNVEYYLANSEQDLVKLTINDPSSSLIYSIEEREVEGKNYYVAGIFNEFENHQSLIQWLYLDLQNIFEYDLSNDKLIKFE